MAALQRLFPTHPYWLLILHRYLTGEPGSSVSIVSGYGLDDWAIEVWSPAIAKGFFLYPLCPDRLWGPTSRLYNGYRWSFAGLKRGRGVTLTTHFHLMPRSIISRSCIYSPPSAFLACSGTASAFRSLRTADDWVSFSRVRPYSWCNLITRWLCS
jgi:hypothetical protein